MKTSTFKTGDRARLTESGIDVYKKFFIDPQDAELKREDVYVVQKVHLNPNDEQNTIDVLCVGCDEIEPISECHLEKITLS